MARGAESKTNVTNKILEMFEGAFVYGKEIRIPMTENGERVEIKVALTCAKTNVGGDAEPSAFASSEAPAPKTIPVFTTLTAPTEEEKQNIQDLMSKLGI